MGRIVRMETAKLKKKDVIICNDVCDDNNNTIIVFTEIVYRGSEIQDVNFTITQYERNRKF